MWKKSNEAKLVLDSRDWVQYSGFWKRCCDWAEDGRCAEDWVCAVRVQLLGRAPASQADATQKPLAKTVTRGSQTLKSLPALLGTRINGI